ncbi:MAG: hypothetical protein CMJ49_05650 [Planctomycetaceae bacterium]|nr:hypothetical protein [Planctomycetaceae bacterium]
MSLEVATRGGEVALTLRDETTGRAWLDGVVVYRVQTRRGDEAITTERLAGAAVTGNGDEVVVTGQAQHLAVRHVFALEAGVLRERIALRNTGEGVTTVERLEIGATLRLTAVGEYGRLLPEVRDVAWVPIPMRRHSEDSSGGHESFSGRDLIMRRPDCWFGRNASEPRGGLPSHFRPVDAWFADGWCCTAGGRTLVVIKHATAHCELCPLDGEARDGGWFARMGGAALIESQSQGGTTFMPAGVVGLGAGETIELGETRYVQVDGDWTAGYAAFRDYFDGEGYVPPTDFDPPVHWNQLYDMSSWHTVRGVEDRRGDLYTLDALWDEVRKARAYHCESLYLDPGWDTAFGSSVWDEGRLGPQTEFVAKLKRDHGLGLSLHCPLAAWSDVSAYPAEARVMDAAGERATGSLCSGSRQYLDVKAARLRQLCADGASFLMYDGTHYTGACFDPDHGHRVPYTPDAQAGSYQWLCDAVLAEHPAVLIELHDVQGNFILPRHFPHRPGWSVENWGNEFMWETSADLHTGKMKYLDYLRRAYSIPTYLHISLINDNEHGLALWYAASTCAHLGIGGTHPNAQVAAAQQGHMAKYRKLKRFFVQGEYFAVDEQTHLHYLSDRREAVLCLFNFSDASAYRNEAIALSERFELGEDPHQNLGVRVSREKPCTLVLNSVVPPWGAAVLRLGQRGGIEDTTMTW